MLKVVLFATISDLSEPSPELGFGYSLYGILFSLLLILISTYFTYRVFNVSFAMIVQFSKPLFRTRTG